MDALIAMLERIGIKINYQKTRREAAQTIDWLGLTLTNKTLSLPKEKQLQLEETFNELLTSPQVGLLLRFIGRATFMAKVAPGARPLLRMLASCVPDEVVLSRKMHTLWCDLAGVLNAIKLVKQMLCGPSP